MSSERLERIKNNSKGLMDNEGRFTDLFQLKVEDYVYLIEQAERVEDLLKMNSYLRKQREENARLREALEFYADKENYVSKEEYLMENLPSNVEFECGKIARQALDREPK